MTSEYLLDSIGLLDDDLILEAETAPISKIKTFKKQLLVWLPTAACVALLLITFPLFRGGGAESSAPADMSATTGSSKAEGYDHYYSDSSVPASSSAVGGETSEPELLGFCVSVTVGEKTYTYSHSYPLEDTHGALIEALPENCQQVGTVTPIDGDITVPHTDIGVYEGCTLWLEGEGKDSTLYLELPEGGYLVCEYSQTYEFSPGDHN